MAFDPLAQQIAGLIPRGTNPLWSRFLEDILKLSKNGDRIAIAKQLSFITSGLELDISESAWAAILAEQDLANSLLLLGIELWSSTGHEVDTIEVFERSAELGSVRARLLLGESRAWLGQLDEAEADLRAALIPRETADRASFLLGRLLLSDRDRLDEAITFLRAGVDADPDAPVDLASALMANAEFEEARSILEHEVRSKNPSAPIVLGNLLLDHFRDRDGAVSAYRVGIELGDAYSAYNLALIFRNEGDIQQSSDLLRWAAERGDPNAIELIEIDRTDGERDSGSPSADTAE